MLRWSRPLFSDALVGPGDRVPHQLLDGKPHARWNPGKADNEGSPREDFGNDYADCATTDA
jgi:hypothetical protein